MRRRSFLLGAATAAVAGAAGYARSRIVETPADVSYPGMQAGHALRDGAALPAPTANYRHQVVILGAGVAGLSCAWKLAREGFTDFVVVQGPEFAGNAAGGQRDELHYPLGAHYLPLPSMASTHVREMLADFGIIERGAGDIRPYYDESILVHSPQERLLRNGLWEDGLLPMTGLPDADVAQHHRFLALIERLHTQVGNDGRKVFCIPLVLSSEDPAWRALDTITFKQWLDREGYTSPALHWYLNYCCPTSAPMGMTRPYMPRRMRPGWCPTSCWTAIPSRPPANRCRGTTWSTRAGRWAMWCPRTNCCA